MTGCVFGEDFFPINHILGSLQKKRHNINGETINNFNTIDSDKEVIKKKGKQTQRKEKKRKTELDAYQEWPTLE